MKPSPYHEPKRDPVALLIVAGIFAIGAFTLVIAWREQTLSHIETMAQIEANRTPARQESHP